MKCDVCGKNMTPPHGGVYSQGAQISLNISTGSEESRYAHEQIAPYEIGRTYHICWACTLRAYGVPEPKGGEAEHKPSD